MHQEWGRLMASPHLSVPVAIPGGAVTGPWVVVGPETVQQLVGQVQYAHPVRSTVEYMTIHLQRQE